MNKTIIFGLFTGLFNLAVPIFWISQLNLFGSILGILVNFPCGVFAFLVFLGDYLKCTKGWTKQ
jgi:hypothetical protein